MNLCEIAAIDKGLQELRLDVEEILEEAQSDLDRDIIVTACQSILAKIETMSVLPTSPYVRDRWSNTSLD